MPQFAPGESKTAIAPIVAKPSGMNCEAELFLGPDEVTKVASSGRVPFVSTGAAKNVSLPITMPSEPGTLKGYIDVFAGGLCFLAYKTTEDITIAAPVVPWIYSDVQASIDGRAGVSAWYWVDFSARITNTGNQAATKTVTLFYRVRYGSNPFSSEYVFKSELVTLLPGESYIFTGWRVPAPGYPEEALTITGGYTYELWLRDSDGKESARVQVAM